jgi:hypothetical protein
MIINKKGKLNTRSLNWDNFLTSHELINSQQFSHRIKVTE